MSPSTATSTINPARAAMNRKLHALLGQIARTGADADAVKADLAHEVSRGRTTHSSELDDAEFRLLLNRVTGRAAGLSSPRHGEQDAPRRDRSAKGLPGLRTAAQVRIIEQLGTRLGWSQEAVSAALKRVPSSRSASALIEEWKSRLVREANLVERCHTILTSLDGDGLSTRESDVVRQVGDADGRARNRLPVGAVLWVHDIVNGR